MFKRKKRLVLLISILLITGFLLTSLTSYFISMVSLKNMVADNELPLTSDNIYSEIQRDLLRPVFISSLMASDTFLRDWVIDGEQNQNQIIRYISEIKKKYNTFSAFFVSEQSQNYYSSDGLLKKVSPEESRDKWYYRVRELTDDYEINVDIDMANRDALTVFINYRVYDYAGGFIGVTGVGLSVDAVRNLVDHYQHTYNRDIMFIDKLGNSKLDTSLSGKAEKYEKELENLTKSKDFLSKITSADSSSFQHRLAGQTVLFNVRYISEFDWYLIVSQSTLQGSGALFDALLMNLAICAVITIVVLIITNLTISSYQRDLEQLATTDKLTGLYNRQALDVIFDQLILDQKRKRVDLSLLMVDLDHFKLINDKHGHLTGDTVLQHVSQLLSSRLRETDIICRWGGEEFLVLLKKCGLQSACNTAEELRLSVLNHPFDEQQKNIETTISIGVSQYQPEDTKEKLIDRADRALYTAKKNGRNQVASI